MQADPGRFFDIYPLVAMARITFDKPALTVDEQLELLVSRGLLVKEPESAKQYLQYIGYYRLSGYCIPFLVDNTELQTNRNHHFKPGTTFEQILEQYTFDRKLRVLLIDAIERIEVAFRTTLSNTLSLKHGPHWYMDESHFVVDRFSHTQFMQKLDRYLKDNRNLTFVQHYSAKYHSPTRPPSWMVMEVLPIGSLSFIYQKLKCQPDRRTIALIFGINPRIMASWIHAISYLRNLCAHHSRVWNKTFTITPEIVKEHSGFLKHNNKFYAQAVVINTFLKIISPDSKWPHRLRELFDEYPSIPIKAMGFSDEWHQEDFWQVKPA